MVRLVGPRHRLVPAPPGPSAGGGTVTGAELDTEYHDWQEHALAAGWSHGELCQQWGTVQWGGAFEDGLECERPAGHDGEHAAVLGMDPDVNDWVRWPRSRPVMD